MITIVVPLDGSKLAEAVLPYVENLASRLHAEVYFVQVLEPAASSVPTELAPIGLMPASAEQEEEDARAAERYLSGLADRWESRDVDAKWELLRGEAASSIIAFARSHKAFMIAMSTHGRSGVSRLVFGSVADRVMREAGIPVLTFRPSQKSA